MARGAWEVERQEGSVGDDVVGAEYQDDAFQARAWVAAAEVPAQHTWADRALLVNVINIVLPPYQRSLS